MILTLILVALAIENLTDILVTVDFLEGWRAKFEAMFPRIGRLARCKYCQSFWLSGVAALLLPPIEVAGGLVVLWFAIHLLAHFARVAHEASHEFLERYLNRAPTRVEVIDLHKNLESALKDSMLGVVKGDQESGS